MKVTMSTLARRPVLSLLTVLGLLGGGTAKAAAPPCDAVALDVAPELGDEADDAAMRTYLHDRLPERMGALGLCADPAASRRVVITVAWSNAARGDYAIALRAHAPGVEPFEPGAVDCPGCATSELLDTIAAQVPVALDGLAEPAVSSDEATSPPPVAPVEPSATPSPARDHQRVGRLGRAGLGLGATGLAGVVTGTVLWAQRSVPHPADSSYRLVLLPAGVTLVATGILATAAGATMIALDLRRARSRRIMLRPGLSHAHTGIVISGAF